MKTNEKTWQGYGLDELRVRRLVNLAKIDLEKMRLDQQTQGYKNTGESVMRTGIASKLVGALDFVDYGLIAFKVGKTLLKLIRKVRK